MTWYNPTTWQCPSKLMEMLEDDKGRVSSTNFAFLIGLLTIVFISIHMELNGRTNEGILMILAGMATGGLITKKGFDASIAKAQINPDSLNPATPIVPAAPAQVFNLGNQSNNDPAPRVKDINIDNVEGNINAGKAS